MIFLGQRFEKYSKRKHNDRRSAEAKTQRRGGHYPPPIINSWTLICQFVSKIMVAPYRQITFSGIGYFAVMLGCSRGQVNQWQLAKLAGQLR
jgi:hypothetical protein